MKKILLTICVVALLSGIVFARDFWEFPDTSALPDDARLLVHDPSLPPGDANRRTRNITGLILKNIFRNLTGVRGPQGERGFRGYSGAKGEQGERGFRGYSGAKGDKGDPGDDSTIPGPRGYDGRDALRAVILDGFLSANYDENGLNPQLSSINPFAAYLFEGTNAVLADKITAYDWYIPVDTMLTYPALEVDGMQIHRQTFTPGVFSVYSASKSNNYVRVTITHVSGRTASVTVPIAITQQGIRGYTGEQGPAASVTADAVFGGFSTHRSDKYLVFRPLSSTQGALLATRDKAGNARWYVDGLGYQHFKDANGYEVVRVQTDGTIALLKDNVEWLRVDGQSKQVKVIRNGSAVFEIYSTGRYKGPEGYPTNVAKTRDYTLPNGFRGYTTGGSGGAGMSNPYTLPAAGQTFRAPSGTVRHAFYSSGRTTIRGSLTIY